VLHDGLHSGNNTVNSLPGKLGEAAIYLHKEIGKYAPEFVIVLGSGLSNVFSGAEILYSIPYTSIPGIPKAIVSGHRGVLEIVKYQKKTIAIMRGRFHIYEGNSPDDAVRLLRALVLLGVKTAILTNASGSTSLKHKPGELALIKDHINITNLTPLSSDEAHSLGGGFLDLSEPYSAEIRKQIKSIAKKLNIKISEAVYACMRGPQYETAAEVKMLKTLGADVAGMSTVPEVIALRQLGVRIACITTVTNYGTGVKKGNTLSHSEVKMMGEKVAHKLDSILKLLLKDL